MNVYRHIVFNPHLESVAGVISRLGESSIWALHHIVPVNECEYVAIFEAWDSTGDDQSVLGKIPVQASLTNPNT